MQSKRKRKSNSMKQQQPNKQREHLIYGPNNLNKNVAVGTSSTSFIGMSNQMV